MLCNVEINEKIFKTSKNQILVILALSVPLSCARAHTAFRDCAQTYHDEAMFSVGKLRKIVLVPAKRTHFFAKCTVQWRRANGARGSPNFLRCVTFYN